MVSARLLTFGVASIGTPSFIWASTLNVGSSEASVARREIAASRTCTFIEPSPTGIICGERGSDDDNPPDLTMVTEQHVVDPPACIELYSRRRTEFSSFFYDETKKICGLAEYGLQNFNSSINSSVIYWDERCFDCPPVKCPKKLGVNLLDNGGFEDSADLFGPWLIGEGSSWFIAPQGENSKYALRANSTDEGRILQTFEACPGQAYRVKADYRQKGPGFNDSTEDIAFILPDGSTMGADPSNQLLGAWVTYEDVFSLPPPLHPLYLPEFFPTLGISLYFSSADSKSSQMVRTLDNINVNAISTSVVGKGGSLTRNSGFESGSIAPWIVTPSALIVSPGLDGSKYALKANSSTLTIIQSLKLVKNEAYLLQFDYVFQCRRLPSQCSVLFKQYISGSTGEPDRIFSDNGLATKRPIVRSISHAFMAQQTNLSLRIVAMGFFEPDLTLDNISVRSLVLG